MPSSQMETGSSPSRVQAMKEIRKHRSRGGKRLLMQLSVYVGGLALLFMYAQYARSGVIQPALQVQSNMSRRLLSASDDDEYKWSSCKMSDPTTWKEGFLGNCNQYCDQIPIDASASSGRRLMSSGGMPIDDPLGLPDNEENAHLVFLHVFGMLYMFVGLAIICDEFFEPSLEAICDKLGLSEDVAGATFMASGSSAPELFTSVMAVFFAESDAGVGTIVGSAVFNVLVIIGACSIVAPNVQLRWWPLTRDSIFYCISIIALVIFINDQSAEYWEGIICLVLYIIYILIMKFNKKLERYFVKTADYYMKTTPSAGQKSVQNFVEHVAFQVFIILVIIINLVAIVLEFSLSPTDPSDSVVLALDILNYICAGIFITEFLVKICAYNFYKYWANPENAFDGVLVGLIIFEFLLQIIANANANKNEHLYLGETDPPPSATSVYASCTSDVDSNGNEVSNSISSLRSLRVVRIMRAARGARLINAGIRIKGTRTAPEPEGDSSKTPEDTSLTTTNKEIEMASNDKKDSEEPEPKKESEKGDLEEGEAEGGDGDDDDDDDEPFWPFQCPDAEEGVFAKIYHAFTFPMQVVLFLTVPDCRRESLENWYLVTFFMSIVWIMILSFFMVWWAEIFGEVCGIPSAVMGLTILAAGTSIPDTLASVSVAKSGKGDMAVSNSIGSNIFDILIGLGFPWFIKGLIEGAGTTIRSDSIVISIMILFITVGMVVLCIHFSGFKLTKCVGYLLCGSYFVYVGLALAMEFAPVPFGLCSYDCPH